MSAVSAFPHFNFALCEYFRRFYVFKQRAVSFFVRFFDSRYETEFCGKVVESLLLRRFWQIRRTYPSIRNFRPLRRRRDFRRCRLFRLSSLNHILACSFSFSAVLRKSDANLLVTFFLRYRSKIGVLVSRLTLPGERRFARFFSVLVPSYLFFLRCAFVFVYFAVAISHFLFSIKFFIFRPLFPPLFPDNRGIPRGTQGHIR